MEVPRAVPLLSFGGITVAMSLLFGCAPCPAGEKKVDANAVERPEWLSAKVRPPNHYLGMASAPLLDECLHQARIDTLRLVTPGRLKAIKKHEPATGKTVRIEQNIMGTRIVKDTEEDAYDCIPTSRMGAEEAFTFGETGTYWEKYQKSNGRKIEQRYDCWLMVAISDRKK